MDLSNFLFDLDEPAILILLFIVCIKFQFFIEVLGFLLFLLHIDRIYFFHILAFITLHYQIHFLNLISQ
jgi:hypothetical protein